MSDIPQKRDISRPAAPDYELDDVVVADTTTQMKALGDPTRRSIIDLVLERAASTTELALALDKPKGTIDHHLKVLERAGMIRVVRTRKVRAMTERYWGRVARTIYFEALVDASPDEPDPSCTLIVREALEELSTTSRRDGDVPAFTTYRHARISAARAKEFEQRLNDLALEFSAVERSGDTVFGLLLAVFPTAQPTLPEVEQP